MPEVFILSVLLNSKGVVSVGCYGIVHVVDLQQFLYVGL